MPNPAATMLMTLVVGAGAIASPRSQARDSSGSPGCRRRPATPTASISAGHRTAKAGCNSRNRPATKMPRPNEIAPSGTARVMRSVRDGQEIFKTRSSSQSPKERQAAASTKCQPQITATVSSSQSLIG